MAALHIAIQTAAALLFAQAAFGKLADRAAFEGVVAGYRLAPIWAESAIALALPPVELAVALVLLSGLLGPWPAILAAGLLAVFAVAMAINLGRGRTSIDCGCGSPGQTIGWGHVGRNLALAALLLAVQVMATPAGLGDWAVGLAAGATIFCLDYALTTMAGLTASRRTRGAQSA